MRTEEENMEIDENGKVLYPVGSLINLLVENKQLREHLVVAQKLCHIYFEIASEAIGEESVRAIRDERIKSREEDKS